MQQVKVYVLAGLVFELFLLALACIAGSVFWRQETFSFLLGGLISILPNTYFALSALRSQKAFSPTIAVRYFMRGQAGKMVLTASGFAAVFVTQKNVVHVIVLLGFLVTSVLHLIVMNLVDRYYHVRSDENKLSETNSDGP